MMTRYPDPEQTHDDVAVALGRSYAAEVRTVSCQPGKFTGNLLRWPLTPAGKQAAEAYALDLSCRWTAVEEYRVVESHDAPNREVAQ